MGFRDSVIKLAVDVLQQNYGGILGGFLQPFVGLDCECSNDCGEQTGLIYKRVVQAWLVDDGCERREHVQKPRGCQYLPSILQLALRPTHSPPWRVLPKIFRALVDQVPIAFVSIGRIVTVIKTYRCLCRIFVHSGNLVCHWRVM